MSMTMKQYRAAASKIKPDSEGKTVLELVTEVLATQAARLAEVPANSVAVFTVERARLRS